MEDEKERTRNNIKMVVICEGNKHYKYRNDANHDDCGDDDDDGDDYTCIGLSSVV